jgi:superfamily II DNA or RNA helicase
MDKYININSKMPLHIPENLFEHYLYENAEKAKEILTKADPSINFEEFKQLFPDVPEYLGKFAEWLVSEDADEDDLVYAYKKIKKLKDLKIKIDRDINSFESLYEFTEYMGKLKKKVKETPAEETPKAVSETPKAEKIENINKSVDKSSDQEEDITESIDTKLKTKVLKSGYECLANIYNSDDMNLAGQGLYVWTYKDQIGKKDQRLKFGQYGALGRGKTPVDTISGYNAGKFNTVIILYAVKFTDALIKKFGNALNAEIKIHKAIVKHTGFKIRGVDKDSAGITSREVYGGISLDKIKEIINETLYGVLKLKNYLMRPEQKEAHEQMIKNYNTGGREFLLAAKMRFGKNFTLLNVAKDLNFKNILVLTYKPQVFSSLKDDINNHVNFNNWDIVDFKDQRELTESKDKTTVFMSSAQLAQYKKAKAKDDEDLDLENTSIEEIRKNLKELKKIHWDMIIADEYHYGTSTGNFKEIIKQLKENSDPYILYVSGTAMKDIAMGRFETEQIYEWSYLDEQKKKREEKSGKSLSKEHLSMPTMEIHLIDISSKVKEEVESHYDIEGGEGFTMKKLISTEKDGELKWDGPLELLLDQIMGIGANIKISPYNLKSNMNHTLWVLPKWTAGIIAMAALMEKMPAYKRYHILAATGNVVKNIKEVEEAINKYDKTITLTCYRFKEGVSIPKWNGVFMLDDGRSIEEYLQAMFRVQNPDPENDKDKCYVFDFNPKRGLAMTYEIFARSLWSMLKRNK